MNNSVCIIGSNRGIGLALVDAWMRAMGGEVVIAEAPGGGADLQLRFSLAPPEP